MASRGPIVGVLAILLFAGLSPADDRTGEVCVLKRWADQGVVVPGKGMGPDLIMLIAEAEWNAAASRDPASYLVRVRYPDGRGDSRPFPVDYPPGRPRFTVFVLADLVRGMAPSAVKVGVSVVDASTGSPLSNTLPISIEDLPRPRGDASASDNGPFGLGKPLEGKVRVLPQAGPDGLRFVRVSGQAGSPGFFVATTEANVGQVGRRMASYDPKSGRSDEFALEDAAQPAINLNPARASLYLDALSKADPSGLTYRLPTIAEWTQAALGGKSSAFWWGDDPTFPAGTNLLGPEPALPGESTAPAQPPQGSPSFESNPFGLAHTFGNAAEWATDPNGGFARMGGNFRTEPASPLPLVKVETAEEIGPDPFVGVRPVVEVSPEAAIVAIRKRLAEDAKLSGVAVAYDPELAIVTLTGPVADATSRRSADRLLEGLWFVAAVENRLETPAVFQNQLAVLGSSAGATRRHAVLDRTFVEMKIPVRWLDPLPVAGTSWWLNLYTPGGGHQAQKLTSGEPGIAGKLTVQIDRGKLADQGLADTTPVQVALSIGAPAPTLGDPTIVSNVAEIRPTAEVRPTIRREVR